MSETKRRLYGCTCISNTTQPVNIEEIKSRIEGDGKAEIVQINANPVQQELAYPINGSRTGLYYHMLFETDVQHLGEIQHILKMNESVLRSMIVHEAGLEKSRKAGKGIEIKSLSEKVKT